MLDIERIKQRWNIGKPFVIISKVPDNDVIEAVGDISALIIEVEECRAHSLNENELRLFYHMLNDRQLKAEREDEIPPDHPSSVYRIQLLDKLTKEIIRAREI